MQMSTSEHAKLRQRVLDYCLDGLSIKEIGNKIKHAVSDSTIRNMIITDPEAYSVLHARDNNRSHDFNDDDAYIMRLEGATFRDIADKFHVSASTVRRRLIKYQAFNSYLVKVVDTDSKRSKALKKAHAIKRSER